MKTAILPFILIIGCFSATAQIPGSLDSSFAGIGFTINSVGVQYRTYDVAVQQDGKIITCGASTTSTAGVYDYTLMRYKPDGSLDSSFGQNGLVITAFSAQADAATAITLQPDGKILAAGYVSISSFRMAVTRYMNNGELDSTFGVDGISTFLDGFSRASDVMVLPDSKIIVLGKVGLGDADVILAKYSADGVPDSSFGTNGTVTTNVSGYYDFGAAMVLQNDGKIVVAGSTKDTAAGAKTDFLLLRYNANGNLDNSFGTGGIVITGFANNADSATSLRVLPDGKILVSGHSADAQSLEMAQYTEAGQLDPSFGTGGQAIIPLPSGTWINNSFFQQDGKAVSVGYNYLNHAIVARANADGTIDNTFGSGGITESDFQVGLASLYSSQGTVQADGKIIVIGRLIYTTAGGSYIARYHSGYTTGIEGIGEDKARVNVYPIPTRENLYIEYYLNIAKDVTIYIENIHGIKDKLLYSNKNESPGNKVLIVKACELQPGIYQLIVYFGEDVIIKRVLIY